MVPLSAARRPLVMMMVRLCVQTPALAAFDHNTMRVMMAYIHKQLGLAGSAAIRLIAAAFTHGAASRVLEDIGAGSRGRRKKNHVELGHRFGLVGSGSEFTAHTAQRWPNCQRRMSICA
jgi:hypothetical protein